MTGNFNAIFDVVIWKLQALILAVEKEGHKCLIQPLSLDLFDCFFKTWIFQNNVLYI